MKMKTSPQSLAKEEEEEEEEEITPTSVGSEDDTVARINIIYKTFLTVRIIQALNKC